ncbi:ABC transporter substrate-binding protein [Paenibacillus methanolicus]|uniref:MarR-like DNA-binding transcriptional regulator SgrR of sgrS sRNA n=1 Tax=Paenibacillus methanolicus TaxID=582686 RepID=A0A5S5CJK7_9BACL|nr:ABC transporter substrate-binding protein [Paenibacillus methanolicus]TYP78193.1 MarR-like DNA-binding transcriptional regulator SgrR of sgrS sRNA [Paenibacillus methanolicus]
MHIAQHFFELRAYYRAQPDRHLFPVTVEKLSEVWYCTPRYVKKIVRDLSEQGWIEWRAGRGRGHTSQLAFTADENELLSSEIKRKMEQGQIKEAIDWMNRFGTPTAREMLMDWLSGEMGFARRRVAGDARDTLRLPVHRALETLDPALAYYAFDSHIISQVFNTLVEYDPDTRELKPCLAHTWTSSPDAATWTFYLGKHILFHHGRELSASDVVFSLNRIRQSADRYAAAWMLRDAASIEAVDPRTVRIALACPNVLLPRFLSTAAMSIVPEELARASGDAFARQPVGTGSFRIAQLDEGLCALESFPRHFRGSPLLDRVEVYILPGIEEGRIRQPDWNDVLPSDGRSLRRSSSEDTVPPHDWHDLEARYICCSVLAFNLRKDGPHRPPSFRHAMNLLLDRERMIADLGDSLIMPAGGFRPAAIADKMAAESRPTIEADAVRRLLLESGYAGETLRLSSNVYHETEASWIIARCRAYGIQVELEITNEVPGQAGAVEPDGFDCRLFGYVPIHPEITEMGAYLQPNYFLSAIEEPMLPYVEEVVRTACAEPEERVRARHLAKLESLLQDSASVLFLVHKKNNTQYHQAVRGVRINSYGWVDFRQIWFPSQEAAAGSPS